MPRFLDLGIPQLLGLAQHAADFDLEDQDAPHLSTGVRARFCLYAGGLGVEMLLIVICFCWMAESPPCHVDEGGGGGGNSTEGGVSRLHETCMEGLYLFVTFYLGLAKGLAFFFARLEGDGAAGPNPDIRRVAGSWSQYVMSLCYFAFVSATSATIYSVQPTDNVVRKVVYVLVGATLNGVMAIDCVALACMARCRTVPPGPSLEEIRPAPYSELSSTALIGRAWHLKECAVCLEEFGKEDSVLRLPCGHIFHTDCVRVWLRRTMACPMKCRLSNFVLELPPGECEDDGDLMAGSATPRPGPRAAAALAPPPADGAAPDVPGDGEEERRAAGGPGADEQTQEAPLTPTGLGAATEAVLEPAMPWPGQGHHLHGQTTFMLLGVPEHVEFVD